MEKITYKDIIVLTLFVAYYVLHSRVAKVVSGLAALYFGLCCINPLNLFNNLMFTEHIYRYLALSVFFVFLTGSTTGIYTVNGLEFDLNKKTVKRIK